MGIITMESLPVGSADLSLVNSFSRVAFMTLVCIQRYACQGAITSNLPSDGVSIGWVNRNELLDWFDVYNRFARTILYWRR